MIVGKLKEVNLGNEHEISKSYKFHRTDITMFDLEDFKDYSNDINKKLFIGGSIFKVRLVPKNHLISDGVIHVMKAELVCMDMLHPIDNGSILVDDIIVNPISLKEIDMPQSHIHGEIVNLFVYELYRKFKENNIIAPNLVENI